MTSVGGFASSHCQSSSASSGGASGSTRTTSPPDSRHVDETTGPQSDLGLQSGYGKRQSHSPGATSVMSDTREQKLEARAVAGGLVDEVSAVRSRIRARDREAQAGSVGVVAALEAVEETGPQILRNTAPAILDSDTNMPVALLGGDDDRRLAVAHGVHEQVGDDAVEHERVGDHRKVRRHV